MRALAALALALAFLLAPAATGMHAQQAGGHATSFDHKTGNEWWVEVLVTGSPSRVEARDDGGSWVALEPKSWGAWAKSFRIEEGHRVQFRASWSDGASVESCWFTHPAGAEECGSSGGGGTPTPPPTNGTIVSFTHAGGNEWWVEAKVAPKPVKVEAMDTNGPWVQLSFRSWGEWAGGFHVEPGNAVRFRATYADGSSAVGCWFSHPAGWAAVEAQTHTCVGSTGGAPPPPPPPAWPREGSFVRYEAREGEGVPGYAEESEVNVTYLFTNGAWQRTCEGWYREWIGDDEDAHYTEERILATEPAAPPTLTANVPGQPAGAPGVGCIYGGAFGTVFGPVRASTTRNGSSVSTVAYYLDHEPIWPASDGAAWDVATGLVLFYGFSGSHSGHYGRLVDTDAPLAVEAPARTSWPFEGSFARYQVTRDTGERATMSFAFTNGGWRETCTVYNPDGSLRTSDAGDGAPYHGPTLGFAAGAQLDLPLPSEWCDAEWNELYVERSQAVTTTRNGAPYKAKVWYADEDDSWDVDFDVWWDVKTGLYVEWDFNDVQGKLVDTDAPLASG